MLKVLRSLTNDSILVFDDSSDINFDGLPDKTTLLFSSSQFVSTMTKKPKHLTKSFILEEDRNKVDQRERFSSSEDFIFQLADELYRYYKLEANNDSKAGDDSSAKGKEEIANRIHSELKKVYEGFSSSDTDNQSPICTTTTLVWLKSRYHNHNDVEKVQNLFKNIDLCFSIFDDKQECYGYVCTTEFKSTVFLIIDAGYEDSSVADFQHLSNVKQIYRHVPSSSTKDTVSSNRDNLCFQLTHDLISHYNKLGTQCSARQDAEKAEDIFLKAYELCKLLTEL
jgi:hypothetical protein